jgi:5-hydroxyisourate hydrolase
MPAGKLTTHVLDTAHGRPAAGMTIELCRVERAGTVTLKTVLTNNDGRTDEPLLAGDELLVGTYELVFHVGDYFAQQGGDTVRPRFLDKVPVRFNIAERAAHYHVPLLCSRFAYSTYRGS